MRGWMDAFSKRCEMSRKIKINKVNKESLQSRTDKVDRLKTQPFFFADILMERYFVHTCEGYKISQ